MTEQERFDRCLTEVLRLEGGYADDPRDPGGETRFGITRATLSHALGRPASAEEVAALSVEAAGGIYRQSYWRPVHCADLPAGLDLVVFDTAVNMGPATAARLLQQALGVEADGVIGRATLAAATLAAAWKAIRAMSALRRDRYRALAAFAAFGAGWLGRADAVEALALRWTAMPDPAGGGAGRMIALLSQWKTLGLGALCLLVAALFALWRIEAGHAQKLAQQAAATRAAESMDQAKAAASQAAVGVIDVGAQRDQRMLNLHEENSHAIEAAPGSGQSLDPDLNAAGRRGLCGFAAYADDPACVQLRGADPGQRPQTGGADGPAAR